MRLHDLLERMRTDAVASVANAPPPGVDWDKELSPAQETLIRHSALLRLIPRFIGKDAEHFCLNKDHFKPDSSSA